MVFDGRGTFQPQNHTCLNTHTHTHSETLGFWPEASHSPLNNLQYLCFDQKKKKIELLEWGSSQRVVDHDDQYHQEILVAGPTQDLLNERFWGWSPGICFNKPPSDNKHNKIWEPLLCIYHWNQDNKMNVENMRKFPLFRKGGKDLP